MREDEKYLFKNGKMYSNDPSDSFVLWRLLVNSMSSISRLRDLELAELGITPEQSAVLLLLTSNNGKSNINHMAESWAKQRNSVSTLIDRMSKLGLVTKTRRPGKRELEIEITQKGLELQNKISRVTQDEVFKALSLEDKQKLAQYLKLLLIRSRRMLGLTLDIPCLT
jgi:DNA-binding MarR family transcriptional regulator